ncbi:hypothetical protein F6R98_19415 [Candidatus Methylospira mobilis]|uniref:Uncharacterized protein n=1 Tax=Candidatus Methylospira mobilis TaxID=1808979 RepID=A0A5Q0BR22_9GAMM|nr:hypothetical protein [Candidatus Methylospira mobilis]QFY44528.1 hypothetical protein F6R98_19415 [Candidatus Methylospira mobilis]WNV06041.1 hypothetical protein RP726_06385 [Candidatus Methylospira mobilis]
MRIENDVIPIDETILLVNLQHGNQLRINVRKALNPDEFDGLLQAMDDLCGRILRQTEALKSPTPSPESKTPFLLTQPDTK